MIGSLNFRRTAPLILIVGVGLAACVCRADPLLEEIVENSYPVESTAKFSIRNADGSIRIYGADIKEIRVQAIKKAYRQERLAQISVKVTARPGEVAIETEYPSKPRWGFSDRSGTVDYVIVVPQRMRISKLELENGEMLLEEVRSDQARADLGNGRLFAHNCFGNLDLRLKTGNLAIVYEWWEDAEFSIRSTIQDGNAFAYIPTDAAFHLIAQTATGKIANDFQAKERRHAELVNKIDMLVGGGGKTTFQFENQDGNIKISEHNP